MSWLSTPENQRSPHYWLCVFCGHLVVGIVLGVFLGPLWASIVYGLGWEMVQVLRYKADIWDSILDWNAVVFGSLIAEALQHNNISEFSFISIAAAIVALAGTWIRYKK